MADLLPAHAFLKRLASAVATDASGDIGDFAHLDLGRALRKGVPEVLLAERKTPAQNVAIARRMLETTGYAIVSRIPADVLAALQEAYGAEVIWERGAGDRVIVLRMALAPVADLVLS